ncbi:MAG: glycosyltransferase family 87 protein, partial [Beijerinckiaceae bacterium]
GELAKAYGLETLLPLQKLVSAQDNFMPWAYPPPFHLLLAPLALAPPYGAYLLFTLGTLALYALTLHRIAGTDARLIALTIFPAILTAIVCGQNGFLTGALIGMAAMSLLQGSNSAGWALGLMVMKPHLAVTLGLMPVLMRRWTVVAIAAAVVLAACIAATAAFGLGIWAAFLGGVRETSGFLEAGRFPLYRMVSAYAFARSWGASATLAMTIQIVQALLVLAVLTVMQLRGMPLRVTIGMAALLSPFLSPYAYDYDLPLVGIGLAILLPVLREQGRPGERLAIVCLTFAGSAVGLIQNMRLPSDEAVLPAGFYLPAGVPPLALGWPLLACAILITLRIMARTAAQATTSATAPVPSLLQSARSAP